MNIKEIFKGLSFWRKALVSACAVFIVVIVLLLVNHWYVKRQIEKGDLVEWGERLYTKEELNKAFPPQYYEAVAKNTPEEVYVTFRQALLDNDVELALDQISKDSKSKYGEVFGNNNKLEKYKNIPDVGEIKRSEKDSYGNFSSYYYFMKDQKDDTPFQIEFIKDENGYWKIKFI